MKLKLSDWASIAEVLSGVAVVVTLVFLIVGIRENTRITRAAAYDRNIDSLNQSRNAMIRDREIARIWQALQDGDPTGLDELDLVRARVLVSTLFNNYEKSYFANKYGTLGESEWSRFANQICRQYHNVLSFSGQPEGLRAVITEEFMRYIEGSCD